MVQFNLPKNSRMRFGKTAPARGRDQESAASNIYRWDPDTGENPRIDSYFPGSGQDRADGF